VSAEIDRPQLARILGMLGSTHDGEALAAGRRAERMRAAAGTTWFELLSPPRPAFASRAAVEPTETLDEAMGLCRDYPEHTTEFLRIHIAPAPHRPPSFRETAPCSDAGCPPDLGCGDAGMSAAAIAVAPGNAKREGRNWRRCRSPLHGCGFRAADILLPRQDVETGGAQRFADDCNPSTYGTGGEPEMNTVDKAVELAQAGIPVFPVNPDKSPACAHGFRAATAEVDQVRRLFLHAPRADRIGMPTGSPSGIAVIDVDPAGQKWLYAEAAKGRLPETRIHATPRGGRHLFFLHPGAELRSSSSKLASGVDIRAEGGCITIWGPGTQ
jgi:hypothetical protein